MRWAFSAADREPRRWDWRTERSMGSSPTAEAVARWAVMKVEGCTDWGTTRAVIAAKVWGWGVVTQERVLLCVTCWAARWQLSINCKVHVKLPKFNPVMFTVMRSWRSSSDISADFLASSFYCVYLTWRLNSARYVLKSWFRWQSCWIVVWAVPCQSGSPNAFFIRSSNADRLVKSTVLSIQ